jgi:putative endonuclease
MLRPIRKWFYQSILAPPLTQLYDRFLPAARLGNRGELAAERFLLRRGYVIIERGYHDKMGEVDIIAVDDDTIVFVEVKTRSSDMAGEPAEAVDEAKQIHLTKTAQGYLKWHRLTECRARFDVIAIKWPVSAQRPEITHFENAFEPVGTFQMF